MDERGNCNDVSTGHYLHKGKACPLGYYYN